MPPATVKEEARKLIEGLPDDATWEDLSYQFYVREAIEQGLRDAEAGRTVDTDTLRAELGLLP